MRLALHRARTGSNTVASALRCSLSACSALALHDLLPHNPLASRSLRIGASRKSCRFHLLWSLFFAIIPSIELFTVNPFHSHASSPPFPAQYSSPYAIHYSIQIDYRNGRWHSRRKLWALVCRSASPSPNTRFRLRLPVRFSSSLPITVKPLCCFTSIVASPAYILREEVCCSLENSTWVNLASCFTCLLFTLFAYFFNPWIG